MNVMKAIRLDILGLVFENWALSFFLKGLDMYQTD